MKRLIGLVLILQLAVPAVAQDEAGSGGGSDSFSDSFSLDSFEEFESLGPEFDPLSEVRNLLAQATTAPMDKQQEKDLKKLYNKEVKLVAKPFEKRFRVPLKSAMGALQTPAGQRGGDSGRPIQTAEARRLSQQLLDKVIAGLRMDQQGPLRRHQSEQARITKLNALTSKMALAGTPLTPEQIPEVEAILARESRLRTLMIVEAKGGPYQSQLAQLNAQTTERLVAVLEPPQRIAYATTTSRVSAPRTRPTASRGTVTPQL